MVNTSDWDKLKTSDISTKSGSPTVSNGIAVPFIIDGGSSDSTGPGRCNIDTSDTTISSQDDMVLVDPADDSELTYFFERFDTTNEVYSGWVFFSSLPRDGSTQMKVLFGNGPSGGDAESARTTVFSGVSGLQLRPNLATSSGSVPDDSGNNYDSIDHSITGYQQTSSDFIGQAIRLDSSSEDYVNFGTGATKTMPTHLENQGELMILTHHSPTSIGSGDARVVQNDGQEGGNPWIKHGDDNTDGTYEHSWNGGTSLTGTNMDFNESIAHAARWDGSTEYLYEDGINEASGASTTVGNAVDQDTTIGANVEKLVNHYDGYVDEVQIFDQDRGDLFMVTWQEATPGGGEQLFSWNAAESTAIISNSLKASVTGTPRQTSNISKSTSSSSKADAQGTPVQAVNGTAATSISGKSQVTADPVPATNFASSTSSSTKADASATPLVTDVDIIKAPPIKYRKPRARVKLIESEDGTEHTLISTDDGSHNYLQGDIDINSSVDDAVDSFEFTLSNPNDRFSFISADDEVVVELGYNTPLVEVFRGKVTKPQKEVGNDGSMINISGQDFGQVLQSRKAAEVYLDETVEFILKDLIRKYAPELDESGIQGPGKTIKSKRIAYSSIFDVIEEFGDRFNYQYFVDNEKVVHFEPKGFDASDHVFEEGGQLLNFETQPNKEKLINEAIIFGGSQTVREEEKRDGDGSTTVFTTTFKPHDPDVYVDGAHLQGGVEGTNSLQEADYLYDVDRKEFTFADPPASGTENVEIRYSRTIPIQAIVRDQASIDEYGLAQFQDTDQNIQKQEEAKDIAQSLVDDFKQPPEEASAEIVAVHELTAGQSATFKVPSAGVEERVYDIVSLNYTWGESGFLMDMNLNEEPRKLKDILKNLKNDVKRTKGYDSGILDLIRKIQTYSDGLSMGEALDLDSRNINDSGIYGHPVDQNGAYGSAKYGSRKDSYNDRVTK